MFLYLYENFKYNVGFKRKMIFKLIMNKFQTIGMNQFSDSMKTQL